jgi:hypothetical protein
MLLCVVTRMKDRILKLDNESFGIWGSSCIWEQDYQIKITFTVKSEAN